jgi:hypothetical protein
MPVPVTIWSAPSHTAAATKTRAKSPDAMTAATNPQPRP